MKTFVTLAALLGAAVGLASAGPLDGRNNDGSSMCDIRCEPGKNMLNFVPGKSYSYKYRTGVKTGLNSTENTDYSEMFLNAHVTLHALDTCRFALKIDSAKWEQDVSGTGRRDMAETEEMSSMLTQNALIFNYEQGVVSRLCPSTDDSVFALNVKRGVLSMIQTSEKNGRETSELDVNGECLTEYTRSNDGENFEIRKSKNSSKCSENTETNQSFGQVAIPRHLARSSSLVRGHQYCAQTFEKSFLRTVVCKENHVVKPLGGHQNELISVVDQKLEFVKESESEQNDFKYSETEEQTIRFDQRAELMKKETNLEKDAVHAIERLGQLQKENTAEVPAHFNQLIDLFRRMSYSTLNNIVSTRSENKNVIDALLHTMTKDAMKVTVELLLNGGISETEAKLWLLRVSFASNVEQEAIPEMMKLLKKDMPYTMEAHLAVSALVRTFLEENNGRKTPEIEQLVDYMYRQLKELKTAEHLMPVLKAIGNMGVSHRSMNEIFNIALNKKFNTELRLAALDALRRFDCEATPLNREHLMTMFTDSSDVTEVRIAAYLGAIKCPTHFMIETVRSTLLSENKESQVASFVFTHMKNLEKRSSWTMDVTSITNDVELKKFELDAIKFSKNYFYELFLDALNMGFETEAGSVISEDFRTVMLNTTLDIFGHNLNIFDTRVRMQKDMSSIEGFIRFFGKEVLYKNLDGRKSAELEQTLKSIMSPEGLQFTRSMMILDTEMLIPIGNGLPLAIAVNATATLSLDMKAHPEGNSKTQMVALARASPSTAVEVGLSMAVKTPKSQNGIRMVAKAFSQWTIDGTIKMDFHAPALIQVDISAPRDRSDIIDFETNVYLVGENRQVELRTETLQKTWTVCSGKTTHMLFGHELCLDAEMPESFNNGFLFRGKKHFNVRMIKTDKSLERFSFEASFVHQEGVKDQVLLKIDTPGSEIDRLIKGRLYNDIQNSNFGLELVSPLKKAAIEGTYQNSAASKAMQILFKVDDETAITINGQMGIVAGRMNIYSPSLEILLANQKQVLFMKSDIAIQGTHKIGVDMEVKTTLNNNEPIKVRAEYTNAGVNKKRVTFEVESTTLRTNVLSSVSYGEDNWALAAEGEYEFLNGGKHTFSFGGKVVNSAEQIMADAKLNRDGKVIFATNGKLSRQNPLSINMAITVFEKKYAGQLSHEKLAKETVVSAVAEIEDRRYATSVRYNIGNQKAKLNLKIELPNGIERVAKIAFTRNANNMKVTVMTDVTGKTYSGVVTYLPQNGIYKLIGDLRMNEEHFQATGALNVEGTYQAKIEVLHNEGKVIMANVGIGKDIRRPNLKISVNYRGKMLLDASTEAVFESQGASVLFAMRAPTKMNGHVALKRSGSLDKNFGLETVVDIKCQEMTLDFGLTSSVDLALYGQSKKANFEGTMRLPRGNYKLILTNKFDSNSWNVEYRLLTPDQITRELLTSGTYSMDSSRKMHLRGNFELDAEILGRHLQIEQVSLNTEAGYTDKSVEYKTEVTKNSKSIMMITIKGARTNKKTEMSAEITVMDKTYSTELSVLGYEVRTGMKATWNTRWNKQQIGANAELQWSQENSFIKTELQTPFEIMPSAKIHLQHQLVTGGTEMIHAEIVFGKHFVKTEMSLSPKNIEINTRTSFKNWELMRAHAIIENKPNMRLTLNVHAPRFEDNVLEIQVDTGKILSAKGRVVVPVVYSGDLVSFEGSLDGDLEKLAGKGKLHLVYRGDQKMKVVFENINEKTEKKITATLIHGFTQPKQILVLDAEFRNPEKHAYDVRMSLTRDDKKMIQMHYNINLKLNDGIFAESQLEAKTTLLKNWNGVWALNKLVLGTDNFQTTHEFGSSAKNVMTSIEASGKYTTQGPIKSMDLNVNGVWESLKGSFSAELKTDHKSLMHMSAKADSHHGEMFATQWEITRKNQMIEAEAKLQLPLRKHEATLKLKTGISEQESFVFEAKLDRDNNTPKTTSVIVHFPLNIQTNIDGQLKVQLPEEMGGHSIDATLMSQKGLVDLSVQGVLSENSYAAQGKFKWERSLTINGFLKKNKRDLINVQVSAEPKSSDKWSATAQLSFSGKTYGSKFDGEHSSRRADFHLNVESNQWTQKTHSVRVSISKESRTAELKMDIAQLKLTINTIMADRYEMTSNVEYRKEQIAETKVTYSPEGQLTIRFDVLSEKFFFNLIARPTGGLTIEISQAKVDFNWHFTHGEMKFSQMWNLNKQVYTHVIEALWSDKYSVYSTISTPSGTKMIQFELKPHGTNGNVEMKVENRDQKLLRLRMDWTLNQKNILIKVKSILNNSDEWNVELAGNIHTVGDFKGTVYSGNKPVGQILTQWNIQNGLSFQTDVEFNDGKKHNMRVSFDWTKQTMNAFFDLTCPWLRFLNGTPLKATISAKYNPTQFDFQGDLQLRGELHAMKFNGKKEGEKVTGSFDITCPTYGNYAGNVQGIMSNESITVRIESNKLNKPIEFAAEIKNRDSVIYTLKMENVDLAGQIYFAGQKYGFEVSNKIGEKTHSAIVIIKGSMGSPETVIVMMKTQDKQTGFSINILRTEFEIQIYYFGKQILRVEGNIINKRSGKFLFSVDVEKIGQHEIGVEYKDITLSGQNSMAKVTIDGQTIFEMGLVKGSDKSEMNFVMTPLKQMEPIKTTVTIRSDSQYWINQIVKFTWGQKNVGYELRLNKNIVGSIVRVDFPLRTILAEVRADGDSVVSIFAWDFVNDAEKRIELTVRQNTQGELRVFEGSLTMPKINKNILYQWTVRGDASPAQPLIMVTEIKYNDQTVMTSTIKIIHTRGHYRIEFDGSLPTLDKQLKSEIELTLAEVQSLEAKLKVGNKQYIVDAKNNEEILSIAVSDIHRYLIVRARKHERAIVIRTNNLSIESKLTSGNSHLVVKTGNTEHFRVGFEVEGNALSGTTHWRPSLVADLKMAAKETMRLIQKGDFTDRVFNWMGLPRTVVDEINQIFDFIKNEARLIWTDLRTVANYIVSFYNNDFLHIKSTLAPVFRVFGQIADWFNQRFESISTAFEMFVQRMSRLMARYSERLRVARAVVAAISDEIIEDKMEEIKERVQSTFNHHWIQLVKDIYEQYGDSIQNMSDEHICQLYNEQHLLNKNCRLTYEFQPKIGNVELELRMPFAKFTN